MTTGEQFAAMIRKNGHIGPRTKDWRNGGSLKADMIEAIGNAVYYPGYYDEDRTKLYEAAFGAFNSYNKHVKGYRIAGETAYAIQCMTPYQFAGLLGRMIDAGVTNCGQGEQFFADMRLAA